MTEELVDLVDRTNQVVGQADRRTVRTQNLLHRGVGILVQNSAGQVYVHQRTPTKDVFPGLFDMFVGGVVGSGESYDLAARRETEEELGVSGAEPEFLFEHLYEGPLNRSFIRVYRVVYDGPITHQESEIVWGAWIDHSALEAWSREVEIVPDGLEVFHRYLEHLRA